MPLYQHNDTRPRRGIAAVLGARLIGFVINLWVRLAIIDLIRGRGSNTSGRFLSVALPVAGVVAIALIVPTILPVLAMGAAAAAVIVGLLAIRRHRDNGPSAAADPIRTAAFGEPTPTNTGSTTNYAPQPAPSQAQNGSQPNGVATTPNYHERLRTNAQLSNQSDAYMGATAPAQSSSVAYQPTTYYAPPPSAYNYPQGAQQFSGPPSHEYQPTGYTPSFSRAPQPPLNLEPSAPTASALQAPSPTYFS